MSTILIRYPEVTVELTGIDGNAFVIMGAVKRELGRYLRDKVNAGERARIIDEFYAEATSGDYDHLLQTCMKWVTCE